MAFHKLLLVIAWSALLFIGAITLSPLLLRPTVTPDPTYERFVAYVVLGILFALAYPRRWLLAFGIVTVAGLGLEAAQYLTPDRHGRLLDVMEKLLGGVAGVGLGHLALRILSIRRESRH